MARAAGPKPWPGKRRGRRPPRRRRRRRGYSRAFAAAAAAVTGGLRRPGGPVPRLRPGTGDRQGCPPERQVLTAPGGTGARGDGGGGKPAAVLRRFHGSGRLGPVRVG